MATDPSPPLLEVRGISKQFSGVRALDDVSLTLARGEVLAIVGENGAGKSTLMRIVAGVMPPTAGTIIVDGEPVQFASVAQALKRGISLIHQELNLADNLSVAANIFLGREPRRFGMIDQKRIDREAQKYLDMVGLDVSPQATVGTLPDRQAAACGDRQGAQHERAAADHGRADVVAFRTRIAKVVRGRARPALARRERPLHFAPAARGRAIGRPGRCVARREVLGRTLAR